MDENMKKIWIGIIIFALVILAAVLVVTQLKREAAKIEIGVITPLTGPAAKYGESTKRGLDLAASELNLGESINGKTISLIYEDSKTEPKEAVSAFQKLTTIHKLRVVIGALTSSEFLAIAPIAEDKKVILFTPSASAPQITNAGDYIFRNCYSDIYEGTKIAQYITNETEYKKIAILHINNDYGLGLRDAFKNELMKKESGEIIDVEMYDLTATDFRTPLSKIKASNPDALYIVGYGEMGRILRETKELGLNIPIFSNIMFEDPDILNIAKEAAEGVIYAYPSYSPENMQGNIVSFIQKFEKEYGQIPDIYAATAYDALNILALAIKNGGENSSQIKETLYSIKDYPGVTGKTTFDKNGDVIKPVGIKKVILGEFKWIKYTY